MARALTKRTVQAYPCRDYNGKEYRSIRAMCMAHGVSTAAIADRKETINKKYGRILDINDYTDEDLRYLLRPVADGHSLEVDYKGKHYRSVKELAEELGLNPRSLNSATRKFAGPKDPLTEEILQKALNTMQFGVRDHTGKWHKSDSAMYKAWQIPLTTAKSRKERGWPLKRILTEPVGESKKTADHHGNIFPSIPAKCDHYGIPTDLYRDRISNGWSEEEALTTPKRNFTITDFNGNEWPNLGAMCAAYGITAPAYGHRLSCGMTQEEALTLKVDKDSALTKKIRKWLNKQGITFEEDRAFTKIYRNCDPKIKLLRPDFYFKYNGYTYIIEADGTQHFKKKFNSTDEEFEKLKEHDRLKNEFAFKRKNTCIVRIKYNEIQKVAEILQDALKNPDYYSKHFSRNPHYYGTDAA